MSNILKSIHVSTQTLEFKHAPKELFNRSRAVYAYCSPQYTGKLFMVKMSIAGAQYVLGYFQTLPTAARFADMASLFFKPYRRGEPVFNFNEAQAVFDLANETEAVALLEKIWHCLNDAGKLTEEKEEKPVAEEKILKAKTVFVEDLKMISEAFDKRLREHEAALDRIACRLDAIEQKTNLIEIVTAPKEQRTQFIPNPNLPPPYDAAELEKEGLTCAANQSIADANKAAETFQTNQHSTPTIKWP